MRMVQQYLAKPCILVIAFPRCFTVLSIIGSSRCGICYTCIVRPCRASGTRDGIHRRHQRTTRKLQVIMSAGAGTYTSFASPAAPPVSTTVRFDLGSESSAPPLVSPASSAHFTGKESGRSIPLQAVEDIAEREVVRAAVCDVWAAREAAAVEEDPLRKRLAAILSSEPLQDDTYNEFKIMQKEARQKDMQTALSMYSCPPADLPPDRIATTVTFKAFLKMEGEMSHQKVLHKMNQMLQGVYTGEID